MITKKCLFCDTDFEYVRDSAKFCSDNCRVKWNYANRKDKENRSTKIGAQALLNQAMDILAVVNGKLSGIGSNKPQFGAIDEAAVSTFRNSYNPSKKPLIDQDEPLSFDKMKNEAIKVISQADAYLKDLKEAETVAEIVRISDSIKQDKSLAPSERNNLMLKAQAISRELDY